MACSADPKNDKSPIEIEADAPKQDRDAVGTIRLKYRDGCEIIAQLVPRGFARRVRKTME